MSVISVKSIFVTGTSRGIGLEFVKQLARLPQPPKHIFATCRNPDSAKELKEVAASYPGIHIQKFDVLDYGSYSGVVHWVEEILSGEGLTVLVNNAGQARRDILDVVSKEAMMDDFEVNAVAPLMLSKAFLPLLKKAGSTSSKAAIVNITSMMGSIGDNTSGGYYPYRPSKAAQNMITKSLSVELKSDGVVALALHPGWVVTDMGGKNAPTPVETSVSGMITVITQLKPDDSGKFVDYKGNSLPW